MSQNKIFGDDLKESWLIYRFSKLFLKKKRKKKKKKNRTFSSIIK